MYDNWARRTGAKTHDECMKTESSSQACYLDPVSHRRLNRAQALVLRKAGR